MNASSDILPGQLAGCDLGTMSGGERYSVDEAPQRVIAIRDELEVLYNQFGVQLFRCALAVTGCAGLAEDAVQDAFQRVFQIKKTPNNLKAYMYRCVRNAAIDLVRKNSRIEPLSPDVIFEIPAPQFATLHGREFQKDFTNALGELSPDERETVIQHIASELTFQEIASLRNRPMGTVTSWYRRGIEKLKLRLTHEYGPVRRTTATTSLAKANERTP